jgi:hypothetical protein
VAGSWDKRSEGGGLITCHVTSAQENSLSIMASVMRTLNINSEIQVFHIEKNTVSCLKSSCCTLRVMF